MGQWFLLIHRALEALHAEESGQDLVEYAMVLVIIALAAAAAMGVVAKEINEIFSSIGHKFQRVSS